MIGPRRSVAVRTMLARLCSSLALAVLPALGVVGAGFYGNAAAADVLDGTVYEIRNNGTTWEAVSEGTVMYSGSLKSVVESSTASLSKSGGGTVYFPAGTYDLGDQWFKLRQVHDVTYAGDGIDQTFISNNNSTAADTEPFNFSGAFHVTVRGMTVAANGSARSTSDALDFDQGNDSLVENVKITASRAKGIIFDGKNADWTSTNNTVRNSIIQNVNSSGIELLASSSNLIENNTIKDAGHYGVHINKAPATGTNIQLNKKSNDNQVRGNHIDNAGYDGINITSGDRNVLSNNNITNSGDKAAGMSGIRVSAGSSIPAEDNQLEFNTATDTEATKTQEYGINITSTLCRRTVLRENTLSGNLKGALRDVSGSSITSGPATLVFSASADAQVNQSNLTTNYGTSSTLSVDKSSTAQVESYLKFSVSDIGGSITSVKLRLRTTTSTNSPTGDGPGVYAVTDNSWTETGITYSNRPAHAETAADNKGALTGDTLVEYDVTSLVTGNGTYSFNLAPDSTDGTSFYSKSGTAGKRPELIISTV